MHRTLKSPCPLATQNRTSLETLIEKSTSGYVFRIFYKHAEQYPHCLCSDNDSKATKPQQIFVDNQGAIQLAKNPKFHERTKHISDRFHFVRDVWERNAIKSIYLPTSDTLSDIMTKNLLRDALEARLRAWARKPGLRGSLRPTTNQAFEIGYSFCSFFGGCTLSPLSVGFPRGVLYTVMSFNEASEYSVFSFSPVFLCIFRTRGSVRIKGVRR